MTLSIRKFLLINLLLAIIFITSISAFGDYYLSQADVHRHMDTLLEQVALSFAAITMENTDTANLANLQANLYAIHTKNHKSKTQINSAKFFLKGKYHFQLWDNKGSLLLYSANAKNFNFNTPSSGFSNIKIDGNFWRVYKIYNSQKHLNFIVAERYDIRDHLTHRIAENNFYIMLITYPISGLLIWLIIGWGLKSLQRITDEVRNRAPTYLEPVDLQAVPIEIKPLIDELNKLFIRLRQAFEREKRFAADAAHELRTPLAALKTQAQVILKTQDENERQTLLQNVIYGVDRIVHIVQQLLTLSRLVPEANTMHDITEVNLTKVVTETIAQLAPIAIAKQTEIELETEQSELIINANLTGISILVRNLIDNAIRYTPENGNIKVFTYEKPNAIIFKVIDSGPGIPPELRTRVFERFYRVVGSGVAGSGLGLAIVQQIAQLHQAMIKLDTPPNGIGLQVEVSFPKLNYRKQ